jgi:hypothetical protein
LTEGRNIHPPNREAHPGSTSTGVTFRSVLTGTLMSLVIGAGVPYTNMIINGTVMAHNFSTPAALFVFFVFVILINVGLGLVRADWRLSRPELAVVYIMAMLATSIPTIGFTENLLPIIAGLYYYATPENDWAELIHPHVPDWIAPQDPMAVKYFFEGLPEGVPLPWGAWMQPILYWCLFIVTLYWVSICLMVILRKQWVENEKLLYPLIQVPLDMLQDDARNSLIKPFFRSPVMWVGFSIPFLIGSINALHGYYEFIPQIVPITTLSLFRNTTDLRFELNLALIGFAYLLNRDVALGFWLFFLLSIVQRGIFGILGIQSTENLSRFANSVGPFLAHQAMGAMIVLVLSGLWMGRRHLRDVFRKALLNDPRVDDGDEVLSYRTAVWGLLAGLVVMAAWLWSSGIPLWIVLVFLFALFIVFLAIARAVVEGGISVVRTPLTPADFVVSGLGTASLGSSGLIGVAFTYVWSANIRIFFLPCFANALKLAEEIKGSRRRLLWPVFLAIAVTLVSSIWSIMVLSYEHGGINLHSFWFIGVPQAAFTHIGPKFADPVLADPAGWGFTALGAGIMGVLTFLRYRFLWWPVHPLGFATGTFYIMNWVWSSVFLAWLFKSVILKYCGSSGYKKTRPFFLGLILGQVFMAGMWLVIDYFTGVTGNILGYF